MDNNKRITICIPTMNSLPTIKLILNSLNFQEIYPRILIIDNGSKDGTYEAVEVMIKNKYFGDLDLELHSLKGISGRGKNIEAIRKKFVDMVETEYLFFLDSDVLLPPNIINNLIGEMDEDKNLGMLGVKYDYKAVHVKMGATIFRTENLKDIKWRMGDRCECYNCAKDLLMTGHNNKHYDKCLARHLLTF